MDRPFEFFLSPSISLVNDFVARREVLEQLSVPLGVTNREGQWLWENSAGKRCPLQASEKERIADQLADPAGGLAGPWPAGLVGGGSALVQGMALNGLLGKTEAYLVTWGGEAAVFTGANLKTGLAVVRGDVVVFANAAMEQLAGVALAGTAWHQCPPFQVFTQPLRDGVATLSQGELRVHCLGPLAIFEWLPSSWVGHRDATVSLETIAQVVHEIRNPLAAITGYVELALTQGTRLKDWLGEAHDELERLSRLTEELLWVSRPVRLRWQRLEVARWVEGAWNMVDPKLRQKVAFRCDADFHGLLVYGDPDRLHQALLNILKNAAEALIPGPEGASIQVRATHGDEHLVLEVHDNGPGIPDEVLHRLLSGIYTNKPGGNGLGLLVSRRLVEAHGGTLSLWSGASGTTVMVRIPQAPTEGAQ